MGKAVSGEAANERNWRVAGWSRVEGVCVKSEGGRDCWSERTLRRKFELICRRVFTTPTTTFYKDILLGLQHRLYATSPLLNFWHTVGTAGSGGGHPSPSPHLKDLKQCTFLAQFFKVCSNWKQELDFNILDAKKTLIKKMSNMHRWYLNIDPGFCRIWRTQRSYPASLQETVRNLKYQTCFVMHGEDFSSIYMKCNFSIRRTEMEQGRFNISFKDDVPSPTDVPWISLDGLWRKVL